MPKKTIEPKEPYSIDESNNNNKVQTNDETINRVNNEEVDVIGPSTGEDEHVDNIGDSQDVYIMNPKHEDRASSFFAQPGVLAAVIGGAVVGLLCAILVVMFIVYRMRKKDEGSYALDEPRRSPAAQAFPKPGAPHHNREFYAWRDVALLASLPTNIPTSNLLVECRDFKPGNRKTRSIESTYQDDRSWTMIWMI